MVYFNFNLANNCSICEKTYPQTLVTKNLQTPSNPKSKWLGVPPPLLVTLSLLLCFFLYCGFPKSPSVLPMSSSVFPKSPSVSPTSSYMSPKSPSVTSKSDNVGLQSDLVCLLIHLVCLLRTFTTVSDPFDEIIDISVSICISESNSCSCFPKLKLKQRRQQKCKWQTLWP